MSQPKSLLSAHLICIASMVVWSACLPLGEVINPLLQPIPFSAIRMAIAAAFLLLYWAATEGFAVMGRANWRAGIVAGALIAVSGVLLVIAQKLTGSVTVAIISAGLPVIGVALEVALDRRRITLGLTLGLALALVGGLIALGSGLQGFSVGIGALVCLGSVVFYATGSRLTVTALPDLSPMGRTTVTLVAAACTSLIVALGAIAFGAPLPDFTPFGPWQYAALIGFSVGPMAVAQALWVVAVGRLGVGMSGLHANATPFYVMIVMFALGAPWIWAQALGAAVVGVGVLVAQGVIPLRRLATS